MRAAITVYFEPGTNKLVITHVMNATLFIYNLTNRTFYFAGQPRGDRLALLPERLSQPNRCDTGSRAT
jgi:hypothetical protein